ncbi:MAG: glycosyltransferase [Pseudomonadota bacterium]
MTFSIIIATLNSERFLAAALDSLAAQTVDVQAIVVDGGSADGTVALLADYPTVRLVEAPGTNIYGAWNAGVAASTGDIVAFLNSDDRYPADALADVAAAFAADSSIEVVTGEAVVFVDGPDGERAIAHHPLSDNDLTFEAIACNVPVVNARFFRRSLLDRLGPVDDGYRLTGDRDYLLRMAVTNPRHGFVDSLLYEYRAHARSSTIDPAKHNAFVLVDENLTMAERWQTKGAADDADIRRAIRRWYRDVTVSGAATALAWRQPRRAWHYARRGWRHDARWPLTCWLSVAQKLRVRRLMRDRVRRLDWP